MNKEVKEITPKELEKRLNKNEIQLIDVREWNEYNYCRIEGAEVITMTNIYSAVINPEEGKDMVVYCHTGVRSYHAAQILMERGFENVYNLRGGIDAYSVEVDPEIPRY